MKHLSGVDNLFLAMDRPDEHLHVACLAIYDPLTAPDGKVRLKSILNHFAGRLNQWKLFRRRLVSLPFGLDRPYWIEDPEIDLEYHIRHIALPHPGDWRQLMIQVARIHSRPLDMTKPLWEAYVIEGLDNIPGVPRGGFAVYTKVHHAAIDGEAGAQLIGAIHSLSPVSAADEDSGSTRVVADREPSALELYARAAGNRAHQVLDASKLMVTVGSRLVTAGKGLLTSGRALATGKDLLAKALERASKKGVRGGVPQTRFDEPLSSHRVVDAVGFPLEDFNSIRQSVDNVTLNDIFLAAVGGGLRRYLEAKGELPDTSVVAMVPITTRGDIKDVEVSNQVSFTGVPLASHIADPLQRLQAVRRSSAKSKAVSAALGKDLAARLLNILPAALTELLLHPRPAVARQRDRVECPWSECAALHGGSQDADVPAGLGNLLGTGAQRDGGQLSRHVLGLLCQLPHDDAGSRLLRRVPEGKLRRTGGCGGKRCAGCHQGASDTCPAGEAQDGTGGTARIRCTRTEAAPDEHPQAAGRVVACFRASCNRGIRAEAGRRPQAPQGSRGSSNHQERSGGLRRSSFHAHGEIEWGIHSRH